jgi:Cys-tRNA(Pro)/Cys-tRNA(Cys) deacylase
VLGVAEAQVFKTLIAELDDGTLAVAVIPVARTLDLKHLSRAAGVRKAQLADAARAERVTGYLTGGISPFGQKKTLPTFRDASAVAHERIYVSGGKRGLQLAVASQDLVRCCRAQVVELCRDPR